MHSSFYSTLLSLMEKGDTERKTILSPFSVALFQNGECKYKEEKDNFDNPDLVETIKAEPHLVIFGSGHVSKAIYDLATILSMKVTVIDERESLLTEERFPKAERIVIESYSSYLSSSHDFFRPYYIIVTHGHSHDRECLEWCLRQNSAYIGMIGSKSKAAFTFSSLEKEGYSREELSKVHSPIGLDIGAVTPEEIALSILGEVISVFRETKYSVTFDPEYLKTVSKKNGISARIIEKKGSAPRAIGSELFLSTDGEIYGTVGGGSVEMNTINDAKEMLKNNEKKPKTIHYNLSSSGDLGMVCGGDVTILFTPVAE